MADEYMTRKERALKNFKQMCSDGRYLGSGSYAPSEVLEDFEVAIQTLSQEPCGDCISRQAMFEWIKGEEKVLGTPMGISYLHKAISELPSVNPQEPKTDCDNCRIKPKWFSVSKRLPEQLGYYIATLDYGKLGIGIGLRYYNGKIDGWEKLREEECVIAWQLLPKPYKGKRG